MDTKIFNYIWNNYHRRVPRKWMNTVSTIRDSTEMDRVGDMVLLRKKKTTPLGQDSMVERNLKFIELFPEEQKVQYPHKAPQPLDIA